jgi:hypothetical protein
MGCPNSPARLFPGTLGSARDCVHAGTLSQLHPRTGITSYVNDADTMVDRPKMNYAKAEPPYCPRCGAMMPLRSAALQTADRTTFKFQCLYCGHTHTEVHILQVDDESK